MLLKTNKMNGASGWIPLRVMSTFYLALVKNNFTLGTLNIIFKDTKLLYTFSTQGLISLIPSSYKHDDKIHCNKLEFYYQ